ncbi:MAG: DUF1801 domain-containing protein [Actinomycetota bacterium]
MSSNSTQPTDVDPHAFVAAVEHPTRRANSAQLLELMSAASECEPVMWGATLVGFGRYRYEYDSGRSGEWFMCGFAPRKSNISIHLQPGYDDLDEPLARLGKHRMGASCLYVNKLADVDLTVLDEIVRHSVSQLRATHETFDR